MFESSKKLNFILILIVLSSIILIAVSCGSSDSNFTSTNLNNTPSTFTNTPTPVLTSKPVSGYLYISNTSLEDGENIENINTLEIPAVNPDSSGSTPLLTQISNLQKENPDDWNSPDIKELCDKLGTTLNQSIALPETAKVFTIYQDSLNATPIPVNNEGYISGQAIVGDTDANVQLEVSLDDDNYFEAETVISSDNLIFSSSDATGVTLKSCPEKIIAFPGEVTILKIYSTINLEKAGLTVTLNNPALGCLSKPVILDVCGKKKHDTAYIFFYARKNLTTPIDGKIIARTTTGLQLEIFTEIVKSCASISGKIFTTEGKPLIKGYVKSIGPKAFCKLDSSGSYTLPRVFCGHFRKIVATYWIEENGKKIRYREEKIIDFFNADVSNFNFGISPTPTPTLTPTPIFTPTPHEPGDPFYHEIVGNVTVQFEQWKEELGTEQAIEKTLTWLNGQLPSPPAPEYITKAERDSNNLYAIWVWFADGRAVRICVSYHQMLEDPNNNLSRGTITNKITGSTSSIESLEAVTVRSSDILILSPSMWLFQQEGSANPDSPRSVCSEIANELESAGYKVKKVITRKEYITRGEVHYPSGVHNESPGLVEMMNINDFNNCIMPYDLGSDLSTYGIIYIDSHGDVDGLNFGPLFQNNYSMRNWMKRYSSLEYNPDRDNWRDAVWKVSYEPTTYKWGVVFNTYTPYLILGPGYFKTIDLNNTILYVNGCRSNNLFTDVIGNNSKVTFIGYDGSALTTRANLVAYLFFHYMMYGYDIKPQIVEPRDIDFIKHDDNYYQNITFDAIEPGQQTPPMNVKQTMDKLGNLDGVDLTFDQNNYIGISSNDDLIGNRLRRLQGNDNTYFPVPITIIVHKK